MQEINAGSAAPYESKTPGKPAIYDLCGRQRLRPSSNPCPVCSLSGRQMTQRPPLSDLRILLATWFGSGYAPKAPGTAGSLLALPFGWGIAHFGGQIWLGIATVIVTLIGVWVANAYMAQAGEHDPGPVVIDEVAGQWLAMLPLAACHQLADHSDRVSCCFRLFDIVKPWPISWADKKHQRRARGDAR